MTVLTKNVQIFVFPNIFAKYAQDRSKYARQKEKNSCFCKHFNYFRENFHDNWKGILASTLGMKGETAICIFSTYLGRIGTLWSGYGISDYTLHRWTTSLKRHSFQRKKIFKLLSTYDIFRRFIYEFWKILLVILFGSVKLAAEGDPRRTEAKLEAVKRILKEGLKRRFAFSQFFIVIFYLFFK